MVGSFVDILYALIFSYAEIMEKKKTGASHEDRKYALFPSSSVSVIAEAEGHSDLPSSVISLLAEDTTYRLREMIQVSKNCFFYYAPWGNNFSGGY